MPVPATRRAAMQDQGMSRAIPNTPLATPTDSKQHPPTSSMSKASEHTATSSEDAQRQMQSQPTAAEQSTTTQAASSQESRTVGAVEGTRPELTEQSKRATAGAAQPAPSQKK